ncbi:bifunctional phosphopantothenoylcysteine decarboxylase/phosphopantothenate--cysteine ligase CoaBC [candidate division WOR-3 bacterium]|nr:bifunctional phosphopantothenoylcysteine decarboxylase/phosphopantothenate--cysteine ligase CoaBC [candidate division WOR-3 bacterium]
MDPLSGKVILVGITGGIAAFKVPFFLRELKDKGAIVKVILTENAKKFASKEVLSVLSDGVFDSLWEASIPHISVTEKADLFVILPADYNIIGKASSGIADDLLSSSIAAYNKKLLFFPSMNSRMFENPIFQKNIDYLRSCGHLVVDPSSGPLACGEEGKGRLPSITRLVLETEKALIPDLFNNAFCLVTGGGTREKIDPVRYLTNGSSGKMAYSIARNCYLAGGNVELILGRNTIAPDADIPYRITSVETAQDMFEKIMDRWKDVDYLFMSAAVSDFTVSSFPKKIKKTGKLDLKLKRNVDILTELKKKKKKQFVVGFSLESENLKASTLKKMKEKGCDLMVGNFPDSIGSNNTSGIIISNSGEEEFSCSKDELAWKIIKKIKS